MAKGEWRRICQGMTFKDAMVAVKKSREFGNKAMIHKNPNRKYEVWVWAPGKRGKKN